jgi:thiosulfate dehydrogenase (quinone) large subunit
MQNIENDNDYRRYTTVQLSLLVILRILIGWHLLYEGVAKLLDPNWTSIGYLLDSQGLFANTFINMAANSNTIVIIDFLNIWGLILIGLGLILGSFTKIAIIGGMVLLAFYYLSHPPLVEAHYLLPRDGNYLWVDKTLIELTALAVLLVFPTWKIIGLDRMIFKIKKAEN